MALTVPHFWNLICGGQGMSEYGVLVRNGLGQTVIDGEFHNLSLLLERNIEVETSQWFSLDFPYAVTSAAPPVLAVQAWKNKFLYFDSVQYRGGPGNWTGASLSFSGYGAHTSGSVRVRVYAYALPLLRGYGLRVRNSAGSVVFDSLRLPLVFSAELGGAPEDWVRVSGEPIIGAGRIDIYRPATWGQPADSYIAVGMALDVEFGRVAVSGGTANAIIYIRWGFTEEGVPRLMQHAYTGLPSSYPGIPAAVYYAMPSIPIIKA
ncbi:TPA: hypothetical protein ACKR12_000742 [Pseudomonas aeruginosa]